MKIKLKLLISLLVILVATFCVADTKKTSQNFNLKVTNNLKYTVWFRLHGVYCSKARLSNMENPENYGDFNPKEQKEYKILPGNNVTVPFTLSYTNAGDVEDFWNWFDQKAYQYIFPQLGIDVEFLPSVWNKERDEWEQYNLAGFKMWSDPVDLGGAYSVKADINTNSPELQIKSFAWVPTKKYSTENAPKKVFTLSQYSKMNVPVAIVTANTEDNSSNFNIIIGGSTDI